MSILVKSWEARESEFASIVSGARILCRRFLCVSVVTFENISAWISARNISFSVRGCFGILMSVCVGIVSAVVVCSSIVLAGSLIIAGTGSGGVLFCFPKTFSIYSRRWDQCRSSEFCFQGHRPIRVHALLVGDFIKFRVFLYQFL